MEVNRKDPEKVFDKVNPELRKADIRFGGLEASLSERGSPVGGKIVMRHDPKMVAAYLAGGFEVVAFASNHCLDYGMEPFLDTLDLLDRHQIRYVGAGRNIAEARKAAIIEKKGTRSASSPISCWFRWAGARIRRERASRRSAKTLSTGLRT